MKTQATLQDENFAIAVSRLEMAGQLAIAFRNAQASLGAFERDFIARARALADAAGVSRPLQAEIERRGLIEAVRS